MKNRLIFLALAVLAAVAFNAPAYAVLPNIFATQPAGNVAASLLDSNFTFLENQGVQGVTTTGSSNAYVATPADAWVTGYSSYIGRALMIVPNFTNSGASTINVSGLGGASIYKNVGGVATALASGDIANTVPAVLVCDGSGFLLANPTPSGISVLNNYISGGLLSSIAGAATTATISTSSGQAADSTNASMITATGYSWAVSNGNAINGYHGGTTLPNSSTIHMFWCSGTSGTGSFANNSTTASCPTGYNTYSRRIGSFNTTAAGAPIPYTSVAISGGGTINYLTTQVADVSAVSINGTASTLTLTSIPTGVKFQAIIRGEATSTNVVILTSPDETDVAPSTFSSFSSAPGFDMSQYTTNTGVAWTGYITTNTSAQVRARASGASSTLSLITRGWTDWRVN